ncbi:hypothetical protein BC831DRAFT_450095 [Entophlyctis helioformis]|nr:hypothetical protein BC831DRAFT_450095 [Entophlyctis helioformis]
MNVGPFAGVPAVMLNVDDTVASDVLALLANRRLVALAARGESGGRAATSTAAALTNDDCLVQTRDGSELVTVKRLRQDVLDLVRMRGGRAHLTDLQDMLDMDGGIIQSVLSNVPSSADSPGAARVYRNEVLLPEYVALIVQEVQQRLCDEGMVRVSQLCAQLSLPAEFLEPLLVAEFGKESSSAKDAAGPGDGDHESKDIICTTVFLDQIRKRVHAALAAATRQVQLGSLLASQSVPLKIVSSIADALIQSHQLAGTLEGPDRSVYVPAVERILRLAAIDAAFTRSGTIDYEEAQHGMKAKDLAHHIETAYPDSMHLSRGALSASKLSELQSIVEDAITDGSFADLDDLLPRFVTRDEQIMLGRRCLDGLSGYAAGSSKQTVVHVGSSMLVSDRMIKDVEAILLENVQSSMTTVASPTSPTVTASANGMVDEVELARALVHAHHGSMSIDQAKGFVSHLLPVLNRRAQDIRRISSLATASKPSSPTTASSTDVSKQLQNEMAIETRIADAWTAFEVYCTGLAQITDPKLKDGLTTYLVQTAGAELYALLYTHSVARFSSRGFSVATLDDRGQPPNLEGLQAFGDDLPSDVVEALDLCAASLASENVAEFMDAVLTRGGSVFRLGETEVLSLQPPNPARGSVKDKGTRAKSTGVAHANESERQRHRDHRHRQYIERQTASLKRQLLATDTPALALHVATLIWFQRVSEPRALVHASGRFVPQLLRHLKPRLDAGIHSRLASIQKSILESIKRGAASASDAPVAEVVADLEAMLAE